MSRVYLAGEGVPIPISALPDPNLDSNFPPQAFLFTESGSFEKTDYENLGYTHFEVICIGGAGGRGGGATDSVMFWISGVYEHVPDDIWNAEKALMTPAEQANLETLNPTHVVFVKTAHSGFLVHPAYFFGGAGGGGGLHVAAGLLADLPDESAVVVGQVGADAPLGHIQSNGPWTPLPLDMNSPNMSRPIWGWANRYPGVRTVVFPPVVGSDGGASTFNDDTCQASGGKGGRPAISWPGADFALDGVGGEGGSGGRTAAGGGGAGATTEANAPDGTWDGTVGKGGGGGHGGNPFYNPPGPGDIAAHSAGNGGRGAYSFADTSVFGPRQSKQNSLVDHFLFSSVTGDLTTVTQTEDGPTYEGGGGGGAKLNGLEHYGSRAPGAHPDGAVFVRLTKIG